MQHFTLNGDSNQATLQPPLRDGLLKLFQKEQDHAMQLLESSPFLASIFMAYANGSGVSKTVPEDEELESLRASYESLRAEHETLKTDLVISQAEARTAQYAYEAEINKLKSTQRLSSGQAASNGPQPCGTCARVRAELDSTSEALRIARQENENVKITHEANLSQLQQEKAVSEQQASEAIQSSRAEVENLKTQCSILTQNLVDQSEQLRKKSADNNQKPTTDSQNATNTKAVEDLKKQLKEVEKSREEMDAKLEEFVRWMKSFSQKVDEDSRVRGFGQKMRELKEKIPQVKTSPQGKRLWSTVASV